MKSRLRCSRAPVFTRDVPISAPDSSADPPTKERRERVRRLRAAVPGGVRWLPTPLTTVKEQLLSPSQLMKRVDTAGRSHSERQLSPPNSQPQHAQPTLTESVPSELSLEDGPGRRVHRVNSVDEGAEEVKPTGVKASVTASVEQRKPSSTQEAENDRLGSLFDLLKWRSNNSWHSFLLGNPTHGPKGRRVSPSFHSHLRLDDSAKPPATPHLPRTPPKRSAQERGNAMVNLVAEHRRKMLAARRSDIQLERAQMATSMKDKKKNDEAFYQAVRSGLGPRSRRVQARAAVTPLSQSQPPEVSGESPAANPDDTEGEDIRLPVTAVEELCGSPTSPVGVTETEVRSPLPCTHARPASASAASTSTALVPFEPSAVSGAGPAPQPRSCLRRPFSAPVAARRVPPVEPFASPIPMSIVTLQRVDPLPDFSSLPIAPAAASEGSFVLLQGKMRRMRRGTREGRGAGPRLLQDLPSDGSAVQSAPTGGSDVTETGEEGMWYEPPTVTITSYRLRPGSGSAATRVEPGPVSSS
eukprot:RCo039295